MSFSDVKLPSNRKFGFFFSVVFFIACGYFVFEGVDVAAYAFGLLASIFFVAALVKAQVLLPLNRLWMYFGFLLGLVVSPIVLGIIFFAIFVPVGLIIRLVGRDELRLRFKQKNSHWITRDSSSQATSFKHQF